MTWRNFPALLLTVLACAAPGAARGEELPLEPLVAGEFALQSGDLDEATRQFLRAADRSTDPAVAERAMRIALAADDLDAARRALARWQALAPDSAARHESALALALASGDADTAEREGRALLADADDGFPRLLSVLGSQRGEAAAPARTLARRLFESGPLPAPFSAWLAFAGIARRLQDPDLSQAVLAKGLATFPDDPRARLLAASLQRESGDEAGAREALRALAADGPLPDALRRPMAGELARLGDLSGAAATLGSGPQDLSTLGQRAAWLVEANDTPALESLYSEIQAEAGADPDPEWRLLLGHVAEGLSRWEQAEAWYQGASVGDERDRARLRLAHVRDRQGKREAAIAVLRDLQADPEADGERIRDAYLFEAQLRAQDGDDAGALAVYARALAVFEGDPVLVYARALHHEANDRVDEALADLAALVEENPQDAQALNAYGYTLSVRRGRHAEALGYIQRAIALAPDSPPVLDSLGWVTYQLGDAAAALPHLEAAWAGQRDPEIAAHLGEVLWVLDRREDAREIWREGERLDPDNRALRQALEAHRP